MKTKGTMTCKIIDHISLNACSLKTLIDGRHRFLIHLHSFRALIKITSLFYLPLTYYGGNAS